MQTATIRREEIIREGRLLVRWVLACPHGSFCFEQDATDAYTAAVIARLELIPAHDELYPEECTDPLWDQSLGLADAAGAPWLRSASAPRAAPPRAADCRRRGNARGWTNGPGRRAGHGRTPPDAARRRAGVAPPSPRLLLAHETIGRAIGALLAAALVSPGALDRRKRELVAAVAAAQDCTS
jgi:hypothetical protein